MSTTGSMFVISSNNSQTCGKAKNKMASHIVVSFKQNYIIITVIQTEFLINCSGHKEANHIQPIS